MCVSGEAVFWLGALLIVLLALTAMVLLYAYGVAKAIDEPFLSTLKSIVGEIVTGRFW